MFGKDKNTKQEHCHSAKTHVFARIYISLNKLTNTMEYSNHKVGGVLLIIAAAQFILGVMVAEALYPGYSISKSTVSYLGIGPYLISAMVFNVSVFLLGLLVIIGTYFLQRAFNIKIFTILLTLTALGFMGIGIFNHNSGLTHFIAAVFAFFFGGLSAIYSYKLIKRPFSLINVILGLITLSASVLYLVEQYFGLGPGGMERLMVYPIVIWMIGFSGYLIALPEKS